MPDPYEIRIHGVSGTPPEGMLDLDAVPEHDASRQGRVGVHRQPETTPTTMEAFSWGGLTSGRPATALYLLLLPFVLANVAGWAMQAPRERAALRDERTDRCISVRAHLLLVRLACVALTGLLVAALHMVVVDLVTWQWVVQLGATPTLRGMLTPAGVLVSGHVVVVAVLVALFLATWVRPRPAPPSHSADASVASKDRHTDTAHDGKEPAATSHDGEPLDPAGYVWPDIEPDVLWNAKGIVARIHAIHVVVALGVLSVLAVHATGTATAGWTAIAIMPAAAAVLLLAHLSLGNGRYEALWHHRAVVYQGLRLVATVVLAAALVHVWMHAPAVLAVGTGPAVRMRASRELLGFGSLAVLGLTVVIVVVQGLAWRVVASPKRPPWRATQTASCLLLLAVGIVAGAGSGVGLTFVRAVGDAATCRTADLSSCPLSLGTGVEWLAFAYVVWLALLLIAAGGFYAWAWFDLRADGRGSPPMQAVRRMTTAVAAPFGWMFAGGVCTMSVFAAFALPGFGETRELTSVYEASPLLLTPAKVILELGAAVIAAVVLGGFVRLLRTGGPWRRLGLLAGAAFVGLVWVSGRSVTIAGFALPPRSLPDVALLIGLLAPLTIFATRMVAAYRKREVRRGVGVMWDLGLFWPRWFHPFAPPSYSDHAITSLAARIRHVLAESPRHHVVLSGHSQGSLLATSALLALEPGECDRVALVTHGSPWGRLYGELFPAYFGADVLRAVCERLGWNRRGDGIRWRNLHRVTDPIGGPIADDDQHWMRVDDLGHALALIDPAGGELADVERSDDDRRIARPLVHSRYTLERAYHDRRSDALGAPGAPS